MLNLDTHILIHALMASLTSAAELALAPVPGAASPVWARIKSLVVASISSSHSKNVLRLE